jgi:bacteriorhodopsin
VVRYLLGIVVTFALWAGLDQIFPEDPLYLALFFRIVRYFIVILWISYFAPWLFVKLRLADTDPAPGINISMRKT